VATRSKGEWIDLLEAEGAPCSIINTLPEAAAHPQAAALDHDPADAGRGLLAGGAAGAVRRRATEDPLGAAGGRRARQVVRRWGALAEAL
jgi:crotonobetainyl-CoA:carnitine CoA-transferase CaiB-like acyl-CoA transferase